MIKSTHSPKLPTVQVDQLNVGPVERHKINYIKCGDSYFAPASSRRTANALPRPCAELVKSMHDIPCTICMYVCTIYMYVLEKRTCLSKQGYTCADPVIRQTESSTWEMGYKCALVSAWIAPKLLPSLLQAHQPIIREAHQPQRSRHLG